MNLVQVCQLVGGSVLADDYRGDFGKVAAVLSNEANAGKSPGQVDPAVALGTVVYWILSGNYYKAHLALRSLEHGIVATDQRWRSRMRTYSLLVFINQVQPPQIRFRSSLGGSTATLFEARNNRILSELLTNKYHHGTLDQLEASLPLRLYQFNTYFGTKQCHHPQFPRAELALASAAALKALRNGFPPGYLQATLNLGLTTMSTSLQRLEYEAGTAPFQGLNDSKLADISAVFETFQDLVGEASCLISAGDKCVSPSFTSPLALNLMVDGKLTGMVDDVWDFEEPKFRLCTNSQAEAYHDRAFQLMEAAGCRRGCGAVRLRQAAVLHMTAFCPGYESSRTKTLLNANLLLEVALQYFAGDEANMCLTSAHEVLLEISRKHISPISSPPPGATIAKAAKIGAWGAAAMNTMLSQFCGLLMLRFARRMLLDHSFIDVALLAVACAKAVFRESKDDTFYLQALLAESDILYISGDFSQAELTVREAIQRLDPVLEILRGLGNAAPSVKQRLKGPIANFLLYFNIIATKILTVSATSAALDEWRVKSATLDVEASTENFFEVTDQTPVVHSRDPATTSHRMLPKIIEYQKSEALKLGQAYNSAYDAAYAKLERGDVAGFDFGILGFLNGTNSSGASRDQIAIFRITANSSLGLFAVAAAELPFAVPTWFGNPETSAVNQHFGQMTFHGVTMNNRPQIDRNQAELAVSLCFLGQDWKSGMHILTEANRRIQGYLTPGNAACRGGCGWKLDFWIGAIYEHNGVMEGALTWYLRAQHIMESFRNRTAEAAARMGAATSIHASELFSGLVRTALTFASRRGDQRSPRVWKLPSDNWMQQALIFAEQSTARTLLEFLLDQQEVADLAGTKADILRERLYIQRQITDLELLPPLNGKSRQAELLKLKGQLEAFE